MSQIALIAKREILTRVRTKAYIITTALLVVAAGAVAIFGNVVLGQGFSAVEKTIGVTQDVSTYEDLFAVDSEELNVTVVEVTNPTEALEEGDVDVVFSGSELRWKSEADKSLPLELHIANSVQVDTVTKQATSLGLTPDDLASLATPVVLEESFTDGEESGQIAVRLAVATIASIATFVLLQMWGSFVLMGVIEEKASRVIEVLLSQVRPATLLSGKLLGLGVLALAQMVILAAGLGGALYFIEDIEIPSGVWGLIAILVPIFILGFAFYSAAFAAAGSLVSRQEDAQGVQLPVMLPLLLSYMLAVTSVTDPEFIAVKIGSFLPFSSPVVLPLRIAMQKIALWEVCLSLCILIAAIFVVIKLAAQIYEGSLLRLGKKVGWVQAWRDRKLT